ncbi:MAG: glycyl radical protein [Bacteroidales bacterium]|jgi:formate C-acetyltransferase|nr:glycyl radical protein [Bacteroidales bacterium]NLM92198.1 glycyl radical protein [Bacteroidales bacterium]
MNSRVKFLRTQSLEAINTLNHERAVLVTKFYRDLLPENEPVPVQRALCFRYILANKSVYIGEQELIVGERGPAPKATPTYPEVSLHSLEDLDILDSRPKVSFKVSEETRKIFQEEIIPFWKGRTNRDKLMSLMSTRWKRSYEAGIFTEFQEQRAPGHTVLGRRMFGKGMLNLIAECDAALLRLDLGTDKEAPAKAAVLRAMKIAAQALIEYSYRHSEALDGLAAREKDEQRRTELQQMASICRRVPAYAPQTFHEALQHYWFIHLGVITELNPWDSFNPGRLDQHLIPFYEKELAAGSLDREQARELLQCFWVKFNNHPAPPKIGVTALESNTYTDFALINMGGVKPDGNDAVNEMSYLILEVIREMRLLQPSSMVQISKKNPDRFIHKTLDIIRTGFGQPSIFNTDAIIQQLLRQGKDLEDARNGGASGCVETGAFGTEAYILTGYFNLTKILEVTLHNGFDPRTERQIGPKTGDPLAFNSFEDLIEAYKKQIRFFADVKIEGNLVIEQLFATQLPVPFLSLLIDDCIAKGKDYNAGGARYNTSYIQGVGLGSVTDSLTALRYHVFEQEAITMKGMLEALEKDFKEYEEFHRALVFNTPKYGNDNEYADQHAKVLFQLFYDAVDGRPCYRGGKFRINMLPTTCHIYFGSVTGAMPDGRLAGKPLSEGISPVQGADQKGPTAVLQSAAKIDHIKTGGTLLNQKFTPSFFDDPESYRKLTALIRTYFRMDGHHIQFNVVSADTLRDAQNHPEKYRDLIVRVAGYSDYFNDLGEDLQNEIIARTEHKDG